MPNPLPTSTCLATTSKVKAAVAALLANDCTLTSGSVPEGLVIVNDKETKVYQAIYKHADVWIVACYNSKRVQWTARETIKETTTDA